MKLTQDQIMRLAKKNGKFLSTEITEQYAISRQYLNKLLKELINSGELIKIGTTRSAFYATPQYVQRHPQLLPHCYVKSFKNIGLEEHKIFEELEKNFPLVKSLPENIGSIFFYAFSEMLNNAIEHSQTKNIDIMVTIQNNELSFTINDGGIGVFRNIMEKRKLSSELEAIQDLLKGKTTTMPRFHSGEGIFFTSKIGNTFTLDSFGHQLFVDNKIHDVFVQQPKQLVQGTRVSFQINTNSKRHLNDIFKKYTNIGDDSDFGFDKTEIKVKLYVNGGVHISRSQARRVLAGLEKFKIIVFDFEKVAMIGQAFADEIFRVFHLKYPQIELQIENANSSIKFMIDRAKNEAKRSEQ